MLQTINRAFVVLLVFLAAGALLSGLLLSLTGFLSSDDESRSFLSMKTTALLSLDGIPASLSPKDSPHKLDSVVKTPPLNKNDLLFVELYSKGKFVEKTDCLENIEDGKKDYVGKRSINCEVYIPYLYQQSQQYEIYVVHYAGAGKYYEGPHKLNIDWSDYESGFWRTFFFIFVIVGAVYILVIIPVFLFGVYQITKTEYPKDRSESYTMLSLFNPLAVKGTIEKVNAFLVSPYFWAIEIAGAFLIIVYMFIATEAWQSGTSLVSFFLAGLIAFIAPFLWCTLFWFADFKHREPLRILVTFFLWGCLAALMAIGMNTLFGLGFEIIGLGFLTAFLVAPPVEEFYKGSGLALLAEHREYDALQDGLVFGFVIGMGFSFVEDWLYMLRNPMGADIASWFLVVFLRTVMFSANHGLFTAITGGAIGLLKEHAFKAPALGLLPGFLVATMFHAIHNSSTLLINFLGIGSALAYFCIVIPLFDYGGLLLLLIVFVWAVLRKR